MITTVEELRKAIQYLEGNTKLRFDLSCYDDNALQNREKCAGAFLGRKDGEIIFDLIPENQK